MTRRADAPLPLARHPTSGCLRRRPPNRAFPVPLAAAAKLRRRGRDGRDDAQPARPLVDLPGRYPQQGLWHHAQHHCQPAEWAGVTVTDLDDVVYCFVGSTGAAYRVQDLVCGARHPDQAAEARRQVILRVGSQNALYYDLETYLSASSGQASPRADMSGRLSSSKHLPRTSTRIFLPHPPILLTRDRFGSRPP
ncbi:hypothetical protein FB451DRAFT_1176200 [Mycena latifolia]|nr:hypothetical protein FB451DRAFT_1176200 [Mycena latifolia]